MPNLSACDPTYSVFWENLKYGAQVAYLAPAAILCIRILYVIWAKESNFYSKHQFFIIYSIGCFVGMLLLLLDIFISRLFVYFPQLCLPASEFFLFNSYIMDVIYPFRIYLHCAQSLIQILLSVNRMSSVLLPVNHNTIWERHRLLVVLFIGLTPFLFIWNTIISKKIIVYNFGGFYFSFSRAVPWASLTLFLTILRGFALVVTVVTTSVTFWRMKKMQTRVKRSERILCVACAINSSCFLLPTVSEALKVFSPAWANWSVSSLIQPFTWDVLNVGSPVVMVCASNQLRAHVFSLPTQESANKSNSNVIMVTGSSFPKNLVN